MVAEEENTGDAATCVGIGEVGGIVMDVEDHLTGVIADDGDRVGSCVVEEVSDFGHGGFGWSGLSGGNRAQRYEQREVYCDSVIEEDAHDALDCFCCRFWEWRRFVG